MFHILLVVVHFRYTEENRINPEWVNLSERTVMRKLGSIPTQNWERQDASVKVAGMPGAAYAQTVKQADWISIHDEHGTQIDVIRGIAMDWMSKTNAVALAGYSIANIGWVPNGNPGEDYSFYRAQIVGESVLASKTANVINWTGSTSGGQGGVDQFEVSVAKDPGTPADSFTIQFHDGETVYHSEDFYGDLEGAKAHADSIYIHFTQDGYWD